MRTKMPPYNRPVILIVDDDASIRLLLQDILDDVQYKVLLAEDGPTALQAMSTILPDLVTLDLDLPGIHGTQVLELIRQNERLREVKVVIISSLESIPQHSRELAQGFIQKPFDIDHLLEIIHRLVPPPSNATAPEGS